MLKHIAFAALVSAVLLLSPAAFADTATPPAAARAQAVCPDGQVKNKAGLCETLGTRDRGPVTTPAVPAACGNGQTAGLMGFCATETQANGNCKAPLKKASDGKCYSKQDAAIIKNG